MKPLPDRPSPFRTPSTHRLSPTATQRLGDVAWDRLSGAALWTVVNIALPVSTGLDATEIARRLGCSPHFVTNRMRELRREIEALADGQR